MERKTGWKTIGIILFSISIVFVCLGFDKLINSNSYGNRYVGGDAYNYIINSSKATAYFILAVFFSILSIGSGIFYYFSNLKISSESVPKATDNNNSDYTALDNPKDGWICSNCGTMNEPINNFCNKCGKKFEQEET